MILTQQREIALARLLDGGLRHRSSASSTSVRGLNPQDNSRDFPAEKVAIHKNSDGLILMG